MSDVTETQQETTETIDEVLVGPTSTHSDSGAPSASQLEEEGEIAADYIEELLDITDLDGDIEIDARGGRAYLSVTSSDDNSLRLLSRPDTCLLYTSDAADE